MALRVGQDSRARHTGGDRDDPVRRKPAVAEIGIAQALVISHDLDPGGGRSAPRGRSSYDRRRDRIAVRCHFHRNRGQDLAGVAGAAASMTAIFGDRWPDPLLAVGSSCSSGNRAAFLAGGGRGAGFAGIATLADGSGPMLMAADADANWALFASAKLTLS